MSWDVQRRDGRTEISCDEITVIKGKMLSEDNKQLVIQSESQRVLALKGSFKYDELDHYEHYYVLARTGKQFKLIDYV